MFPHILLSVASLISILGSFLQILPLIPLLKLPSLITIILFIPNTHYPTSCSYIIVIKVIMK